MPEKLVFLPFSHSVACFDSLILARLIAQEDLFLRYFFFWQTFCNNGAEPMPHCFFLSQHLTVPSSLLSGPNQNSRPALPGSWAVFSVLSGLGCLLMKLLCPGALLSTPVKCLSIFFLFLFCIPAWMDAKFKQVAWKARTCFFLLKPQNLPPVQAQVPLLCSQTP